MKTVAAALFAATQAYQLNTAVEADVSGVPISDLTTVEYNTIIFGIAYGFIDKEGLTEIELCISDAKSEALLAYEAFGSLNQGDWTAGLADIATIVKALPPLLGDCKSIGPDIATLEAYALNLESQTDIKVYIR